MDVPSQKRKSRGAAVLSSNWISRARCTRVMQFYNFRNRRSTIVHEFPQGTNLNGGGTSMSVSPDGRWILYTQLDQVGSNLVLVENFQ
jgi:hypothetical protein